MSTSVEPGFVARVSALRRAVDSPTAPTQPRSPLFFLGLDFGTSFTKVCCRDPARDKAWVVPLTDTPGGLLPSILRVDPSGRIGPVSHLEQGLDIRFLKMCLSGKSPAESGVQQFMERYAHGLDATEPEAVEALCSLFLAHVISRSQRTLRAPAQSNWISSVGMPVAAKGPKLRARFRRVLSVADTWAKGRSLPETVGELMPAYRATREIEPNPDCHVLPEIHALFHSLTRLRGGRRDVYLVVDIGGGTVEVAAVHWADLDGEDRINVLAWELQNVGVSFAADRLDARLPWSARERSIMELPRERRPLRDSPALEKLLRRYQQMVGTTIKSASEIAWYEWRQERRGHVTIRAIGGGASSVLYRSELEHVASNRKVDLGIRGVGFESLPMPRDIEGIGASEFHRFAVAYGLTIPEANISFKSPADFQAHPRAAPRKRNWEDGFDALPDGAIPENIHELKPLPSDVTRAASANPSDRATAGGSGLSWEWSDSAEHEREATDEIRCWECGGSYSARSLVEHLRVRHNLVLAAACPFCPRAVRIHEFRRHVSEKHPSISQHARLQFVLRWDLGPHQNSWPAPSQCPICKRRVTRESAEAHYLACLFRNPASSMLVSTYLTSGASSRVKAAPPPQRERATGPANQPAKPKRRAKRRKKPAGERSSPAARNHPGRSVTKNAPQPASGAVPASEPKLVKCFQCGAMLREDRLEKHKTTRCKRRTL